MTNTMTTLNTLAADINREHHLAEESAQTAVEHAISAGELLIQAKAQHKHDGWLKWLKSYV